MRVLGLDVSKHVGWAHATEEGEILETGVFNEPDESDDSEAMHDEVPE